MDTITEQLVQLLRSASERADATENENKNLREQLEKAKERINMLTSGKDFESQCRRIVLNEQNKSRPSKIEAIKELRSVSKIPLREAKDGIDLYWQ